MCNHPALVRPRVSSSPLQFVDILNHPIPDPTPAQLASNDTEYVSSLSSRSALCVELPRLVHHDGILSYSPHSSGWHDSLRNRLLYITFNIFTAEYIHHSLFPRRRNDLPVPVDAPEMPDASGFGWRWGPSAIDAPVAVYIDNQVYSIISPKYV